MDIIYAVKITGVRTTEAEAAQELVNVLGSGLDTTLPWVEEEKNIFCGDMLDCVLLINRIIGHSQFQAHTRLKIVIL